MTASTEMSDLRRFMSSAGLYGAAAFAERSAGFLLLPLYTRVIDPAEYGVLEILNVLSSIAFILLTLGLVSAINKCYHRDCQSALDQAAVLPTAILIDLPVLLLGAVTLVAFAEPISGWLVGDSGAKDLIPLVAASGVCYSAASLILASLRAQERALAFCTLTLTQFLVAMGLNIVLVAGYGLGIRGILWGNLISYVVSLPIALVAARHGSTFALNRRLVRPLLQFGILLVPVMLAGWVMNMSDRYLLRVYRDLGEVAVYGVGYKFGMILELAIVWPFQLAWPAFSFAISHREGHKETYARTLTYLTVVLVFFVLAMSLSAPDVLAIAVGPKYRDAHRVVPLVALAYALNGIQYCLSPGVHLAGHTRRLSLVASAAAGVNLGLNFLLIPRFGMMGAAWATVAAFFFMALATGVVAQRGYPVRYEYGRLIRVLAAGGLVYVVATSISPEAPTLALAWHAGMSVVAFPAALVFMGALGDSERRALLASFRWARALLLVTSRPAS